MPALRGGKTEEGEEGTPVPVWPETSPDVLLPGVSSAGGGGGSIVLVLAAPCRCRCISHNGCGRL